MQLDGWVGPLCTEAEAALGKTLFIVTTPKEQLLYGTFTKLGIVREFPYFRTETSPIKISNRPPKIRSSMQLDEMSREEILRVKQRTREYTRLYKARRRRQ
jgi:hypothetical protein